MNVRYRVELSESERLELQGMLSGGEQAVRRLKRAQILLASDAGQSEEAIASTLGVGISTVYRTRRRSAAARVLRKGQRSAIDSSRFWSNHPGSAVEWLVVSNHGERDARRDEEDGDRNTPRLPNQGRRHNST